MSIRLKSLIIFLVVSMLPLSILSLVAYYDFGTTLFYAQVAVIAIIVTLVSLLVAQHLSNYVIGLADAAQRIAEGDFDVRIETDARDELGRLAGHFNDMALRLKEQRESVELARSDAERASIVKSEFMTNISHEIKTPMNGILGMSELLSDTDLTSEQRECLGMLQASASSMMTLLNDMLDFSRLEGGTLDIDEVHFELRDAIGEVMVPFLQAAKEKSLEASCHVDQDVPNGLVGDPARLRQVVANLIGNALKFTRQGGFQIRIGVESMTNEDVVLRFRIRDTGCGIPEEKQKDVFNAFAQADGTATRSYEGVGLGLTIASRIIVNMSGSIWVQSPSNWMEGQEEEGSEFHFTVHMGIQGNTPLWVDRNQDISTVSVLVVNPNPHHLKVYRDLVASWGMQVDTADSGPAALEKLKLTRHQGGCPDMILLESPLEEMSGFELAESVSAELGRHTVRLVMLTTMGTRGDARKCRESGISAYLTRPVRAYELLQAIREVLSASSDDLKSDHFLVTRHSLRETRKRFKILILESDIQLARELEDKLVSWRHHVDQSETEQEAEIRLMESRYDVLLLGPNYTSDILASLRTHRQVALPESAPPFPLTVGFSAPDPNAQEGGHYLQLQTPFRAEQLYQAVHDVMMEQEPLEELPLHEPELAVHPAKPEVDSDYCFRLDEALHAVDHDLELFSEVVEIFAEDAPVQMKKMISALEENDLDAVSKVAHSMKGSLGNFRCDAGYQLASRMEVLAHKGQGWRLEAQVQELQSITAQLIQDLRAAVNQ